MRILAVGASWLVRGYQWTLSPLLPRACRFYPSCSEYAREVFLSHGLARGLFLAVRRVGRCHPFNPGGFDPPPVPNHNLTARNISR
jgi:putative membrane protein insertion efficiency factor